MKSFIIGIRRTIKFNKPIIDIIINKSNLEHAVRIANNLLVINHRTLLHYSQTKISSPDFVKLAESYGALGIRVFKEEEIVPALKHAIEFDGPVVIDFICEDFEMVYPWVLAGQPIDKVLLSREDG